MLKDISDRKKDILEAIVNDFVETAEPVGSGTITRRYLHSVSPATVRNEMHELEQEGFITHPHISAGRIPTDIGYRYYVDRIMEKKSISGRDITLIKSGIKKIGRGVEEVVRGTLKTISSLLSYAAVFVSFGKKRLLATSGLSNMLRQPEFQHIDYARSVVATIEREELIKKILEEYAKSDPLTIKIGHENRFREVKDLSIVVTHYTLSGLDPCAIGIIGPTRMDYNRVTTVMQRISSELQGLFNEEIMYDQ